MPDRDTWQEIFETLRRNKLRTFLTACGVFWGVFMLVTMLGFSSGLSTGVQSNMSGLTRNSLFVWGQRTTLPHRGMQPGRYVQFDNADIQAIRDTVPGIAHLAPRNRLGGRRDANLIRRGTRTGSFHVMGDHPAIRHIQTIELSEGRFLDELDIAERRKVAVIGQGVSDVLHGPGEPVLGSSIEIAGVYFQVVGTFRSPRPGEAGEQDNTTIYVPFTTFQQAFHKGDRVGWMALAAEADVDVAAVEKRVRTLLTTRHRIAPDDEPAIGTFNAQEEFAKLQGLFAGIRTFTWVVGVLTLLAGVIGVSNIMLIAIKERTRELGIRKALGATPLSVTSLVVQESLLLTVVSGYGGLVAAVGLLELVGSLVDRGPREEVTMFARPEVDISVALLAIAVLAVAGLLAAVIPARHAARIHPVEALRAE